VGFQTREREKVTDSKKQRNLTNEEVLAAFSDWRSQTKKPMAAIGDDSLLSEEQIARELSTVRRFAEFIAPNSLAQSSKAEIKEFKEELRREITEISRTSIEPEMAMSAFGSFRDVVLKGKKPKPESPDIRLLRIRRRMPPLDGWWSRGKKPRK
jgi:hypothetical protein